LAISPPEPPSRLVAVQDIRIGFGQINPVVGDFDHNLRAITNQLAMAGSLDLVIFGELALCGYPLGDLSYRSDIIEKSEQYLQKLVAESKNFPQLTIVVGHVSKAEDKSPVQSSFAIAHNSASVIRGGEVVGRYDKQILPNYDVFDDWRNFVPGSKELVFELKGQRVAVAICEDIWSEDSGQSRRLSSLGVDLLVVPNGSPYTRTKSTERRIAARKFQAGFALAYANLCGGQDELVFDGDSFLLDKSGKEVLRAPFAERLITDSDEISELLDDNPMPLFEALVVGLRDYCKKNSQTKIVLGLSGGIDSALSCAIAAEAIGASNVLGVALPSRYSSNHSIADAQQLASNIGCEFRIVEIDSAHRAVESSNELSALAQENLQARLRAVILMGISNSENRLLLSTGNKSEIAVGYSTIYGDAAGGFAPIKDVFKTDVWWLAKHYNQSKGAEVIPASSITKAPSAELRPGQLDQDTLPDYQVLDDVLRLLIEKFATVEEVVALGFDRDLVSGIDEMVRKAEWKRSQGAIGTKTTALSFGSGRRVPITTRFGKL
jgi:NAD+ synthase (glutamine-hydrolysing)